MKKQKHPKSGARKSRKPTRAPSASVRTALKGSHSRDAARHPKTPATAATSTGRRSTRVRRSTSPSWVLWCRAAASRMWPVERADAVMLVLPFVLVATTIGVVRWNRAMPAGGESHHWVSKDGGGRALVGLPRRAVPVPPVGPGSSIAEAPMAPSPEVDAAVAAGVPARPVAEPAEVARQAAMDLATARAAQIPTDTPHAAPPYAVAQRPVDQAIEAGDAAFGALNLPPVTRPGDTAQPIVGAPAQIAGQPQRGPDVASLGPDDAVAVRPAPHGMFGVEADETQCHPPGPETPFVLPAGFDPADAEAFGMALAQAARTQLDDFVIYNDRYTRLAYPMGDVNPMYGVCTDVIIRAYRALGIDLQALVQTTRSGSGDPNIDHRRVDTLRRFLQRHGETLPISNFAEDFRPGDIVTYWRPQNRHSRTHIAIVSDMIGPSGRPLIIHNRGWGPQQEDGLFVDQITGHFRFSGLKAGAGLTKPGAKADIGAKAKRISAAPERPLSQVIRTGLPLQGKSEGGPAFPPASEK